VDKPLFERILELTGLFETSTAPPKSYGVSVGNFDGAGMSFGVIQFNLLTGTIQPMLRTLLTNSRPVMEKCFGKLLPELEPMLATRSTKEQIAWAEKRTVQHRPLMKEWAAAFMALGLTPECQAIQRDIAKNRYYARACQYLQDYGLWSERALALMFDICVQNGSIQPGVKKLILADFNKITETDPAKIEVERMKIVANRRSESSASKWVENVRRRKLTIATGKGVVNGMKIDLDALNIKLVKAVI
jgi:hypothetical protein